mgnify:CR=1 FL=1
MEVKEDLIADKVYGRWQSLEEWFTGTDGKDSEAAKVFDTTNEIIRKITRYAARISEMSNAGANRREEYHKVAVMFSKCKNIFEAHRLAAVVFGIEKPLHLKRASVASDREYQQRRVRGRTVYRDCDAEDSYI